MHTECNKENECCLFCIQKYQQEVTLFGSVYDVSGSYTFYNYGYWPKALLIRIFNDRFVLIIMKDTENIGKAT